MKASSLFKKCMTGMLFLVSANCLSTTVEVGPVYLDSVTIIGVSAFGHQAGNLEIKVTNGFDRPTTMTCDSSYIATKNTVPNFKEMVSVLIAAQVSQKQVRLGITDDSSLTAFGGRCSLVSATILK